MLNAFLSASLWTIAWTSVSLLWPADSDGVAVGVTL